MSTMVRLNSSIRQQIVQSLLNKKYVKDELALDEMRKKTDEAKKDANKLAYEACFTAPVRKLLADAAPGFYPEQGYCQIRVETSATNYVDMRAEFGEMKRIPFKNHHYGGNAFAAVIPNTHPYMKAVEAATAIENEWDKAWAELNSKMHADTIRITRVLESVTTVKRLTEVWPEVVDFLPEEVSGPAGGLPAEVIADLNRAFGL